MSRFKQLVESAYEYDPRSDEDNRSIHDFRDLASEGLHATPENSSTEDNDHSIALLDKHFGDGPLKHMRTSITDFNDVIKERDNLNPAQKFKLLHQMTMHNKKLGADSEPSDFATDIQEKHLMGHDYDEKNAVLPHFDTIHDAWKDHQEHGYKSETERIFGSEAGYNKYRHG